MAEDRVKYNQKKEAALTAPNPPNLYLSRNIRQVTQINVIYVITHYLLLEHRVLSQYSPTFFDNSIRFPIFTVERQHGVMCNVI